MAVDLIGYSTKDHLAVQEAATAGLRAMEHLVLHLSSSPVKRPRDLDCSEITDFAVSKFRKVISILDRTGHARFRRGPTSVSTSTSSVPLHDLNFAPPPENPQTLTFDFTASKSLSATCSFSTSQPLSSSNNSSHKSSVTGEGSVNGKLGPSILVTPPPVAPSVPVAVKPPKCPSHSHSAGVSAKPGTSGSRCHCSKKRKSRVKRTIRVPAISSKIADIPADDYSWRKYGQKPIKGSPYPRSYYKCSTVRGCPARKHVEKAPEEPNILIVTYEGEHQHAPSVAGVRPFLPAPLVGRHDQ